MSELSKQASVTFVKNILHSGKTNTRTTNATWEVHEERMTEYAQVLTTDLLQEATKNLNKVRENSTHRPLTAIIVRISIAPYLHAHGTLKPSIQDWKFSIKKLLQ